MLSSKRLQLLLAAILALSSTVLIVAAYRVSGTTTTTPKVLTAKLVRRHDKIKDRPSLEELKLLRGQVAQKEERVLEDKIPQHLPIKVKIKPEKEKAFKDLDNDFWQRDLELEVKNTGTRAIYYMVLLVDMPELKYGEGNMIFALRFGDKKFMNFATGAKPGDVSLKPGETCILRVKHALDWKEFSRDMPQWTKPKEFLLKIQEISFGDGTGFRGTGGTPWPMPDQKAALTACLQSSESDIVQGERNPSKPISSRHKFSLGGEPASFLPAKFSYARKLLFLGSITVPVAPGDSCCTGDCYRIYVYDSETACYGDPCESIHRADFVLCSNALGRCGNFETKYQTCVVNEDDYHYSHRCAFAVETYCEVPTPTPTASPSPSPSPTCNPNTKPNNKTCSCVPTGNDTVDWSCDCADGSEGANYRTNTGNYGCPPNKVNNGNDCCVCVAPQQCGEGCNWDPYFCRCVDFIGNECGAPTPPAGGGGGDEGSGEPIYDRQCIDYYYVYFISYDGGNTWHYMGREYAGCWDYY